MDRLSEPRSVTLREEKLRNLMHIQVVWLFNKIISFSNKKKQDSEEWLNPRLGAENT